MANNKSKVGASLVLPDGRSVAVELSEREFKSGNTGWFIRIPNFAYRDHIYGGSGNIYRMDRKAESTTE